MPSSKCQHKMKPMVILEDFFVYTFFLTLQIFYLDIMVSAFVFMSFLCVNVCISATTCISYAFTSALFFCLIFFPILLCLFFYLIFILIILDACLYFNKNEEKKGMWIFLGWWGTEEDLRGDGGRS